jgi:hypothetical protein
MRDTGMGQTNRYNPIKFMKDPKKSLFDNRDDGGENDSMGGRTSNAFFTTKDMTVTKREYNPNGVPTMIPEQMTSSINVYNSLSNRIDNVK